MAIVQNAAQPAPDARANGAHAYQNHHWGLRFHAKVQKWLPDRISRRWAGIKMKAEKADALVDASAQFAQTVGVQRVKVNPVTQHNIPVLSLRFEAIVVLTAYFIHRQSISKGKIENRTNIVLAKIVRHLGLGNETVGPIEVFLQRCKGFLAPVRLIDMHSHWGTERGWRGNPFAGEKAVAAFRKYWNWDGGFMSEAQMANYFRKNGVSAILSLGFTDAMPIEQVREQHDYAFETQSAYPDVILGHWIKVNPHNEDSMAELRRCIANRTGFLGVVIPRSPPASDPVWARYLKLCLDENVPVMILVGTSAIGAGTRGGMGILLDDTHPRHLDYVAAKYPELTIMAARPAWPWQAEMNAIALHKANVWYELHGWSPKYHPPELKHEISKRLQDRVMFAADFPMLTYERLVSDWRAEGYSEPVLEKVFHQNAEKFFDEIGLAHLLTQAPDPDSIVQEVRQ